LYVELLARRRDSLQPWLGRLAAHGHRSDVQGALLQVWWDFGARQLHVQANLGPAGFSVEAPAPGTEVVFETGDNEAHSLAGWGGRWSWLLAPPG
jgi:hypothetical protein